jgi:hypothetical protein
MEAEISPLQRAFTNFLLGLSRDSLDEILEYIDTTPNLEHNVKHETQTIISSIAPEVNPPRRSTVSRAGSHCRSGSLRNKKLRPLNSFIAFRSMISPRFEYITG